MTLLSTKGLSKSFDGLEAVSSVDFELPAGQIRALIGPNGAGKTTFVSLICGRLAPTSGTVTFDGYDITVLPAHERIQRGIAYTFQITSIFPGLSARENIALAARRFLKGAQVTEVVEATIDKVGLLGRADQTAGDLAYGHKRLLEIGMGLAQNPRLLILDEPTQGLSDGEIEAFKELIRDLADQATILLIEHNMKVVMATANKISVLDGGRMLAEGTPEEIQNNFAVQTAYLGRDDA
ncbi:Lipopolysaccharide export system ATP-binding protein LptB [Roseovarius albus]|uniref:Lipopolysaccharide export system ATP-binding protein LptB n=1 Tax=Roseovarius albus TaxID=1247867 RepID=A0A1X6ZVM3_9RHOB|nr:ABC transporter ATP-binding protein [Roseovarius albus]SLN63008.1 Lipopolysaccharide export system ATP-binding protein LptB [Roseovarius albus]